MCNRIMLVDDDSSARERAAVSLEQAGFDVASADNSRYELDQLDSDWPGIVVANSNTPARDGMRLLDQLQKLDTEIPMIWVNGHDDMATTLEAYRPGGHDFMDKPVSVEQLVAAARQALEKRALVLEDRKRNRRSSAAISLDKHILGDTDAIIELRRLIETLADVNVDVLIQGETGTGKELVARALHDLGQRSNGAFVALNCGGLPDGVIESELFGHEKGAFTGAHKRRIGKLELASGGTLFLDEIESMPVHTQSKLLRVLQERTLERLGGNETIKLDIRVVAATKIDLHTASRENDFRADLYYRLSATQLDIPPLRERIGDLKLLFTHFIEQESQRLSRHPPPVTPAYLLKLYQRPWPGNVRELRNQAQQFILGLDKLAHEELPAVARDAPDSSGLDRRLQLFETQVIEEALLRNDGHMQDTAAELGIPRKRLYLRMRRLELNRASYRHAE